MSTTKHIVSETCDENEVVLDASFKFSSWDDLEINPLLLRGIYSYGFEVPSIIQQQAIKPLIMGRDIVVQAQSGTGKTATFTIGEITPGDGYFLDGIVDEVRVYRRALSSTEITALYEYR